MKALRLFERELKLRSLKKETSYRYLRIARLFLEYAKGSFSKETVSSFLNSLHGSPSYKHWCFYALRYLFQAIGQEWQFKRRETPKRSRPFQPSLEFEEGQRLLELAKKDPLAYPLFRVAMVSGARRGELCALNQGDYKRPRLHINTLKGGETRVIELDEETCDALDLYLNDNPSADDALFVNAYGRRLTPWSLSQMFRKYADRLALPKGAGMHTLRRSVCTWLHERGVSERELQEWMGWRNPYQAHQYIRLSKLKVGEKVKGLHPLMGKVGEG